MAPEQSGQMNRPIDSRSDLYSLGVVLYQLLAGRLPFEADDAIGWVHAHLARQPRPLELAVIDHGIGIDPARRSQIFERFERAVSSSSYGGLGLYIARSIVVAHGGAITVDGEPGQGSTFTVTLPCAPPRA